MRKLLRLALFLIALVIVAVGLLLLRNYEMDAGVHAIKEENGIKALGKLMPLAYLGDSTAQMIVGSTYAYGMNGVSQSDTKAIYWFRRCGRGAIGARISDDGVDPAAPYELSVAKAYANGSEGVKADPIKSKKWLVLAAKSGSKDARAMLAASRP